MKGGRKGAILALVAVILFGAGCGSGDGSGAGTVAVSLADAKPQLPVDAEQVLVTFDEVSVHKAGGDWVSLPMADTPFSVDLLQFSDGRSTRLVPPVELDSGRYTQVRLELADNQAGKDPVNCLVLDGGQKIPLTVPSGFLRTDKNFEFEVEGESAVDLTVDFDLSRSIVAQGNGRYHLKPVLHLQETAEAARIQGEIAASSFGASDEATVTVTVLRRCGALYIGCRSGEGPCNGSRPLPFTIYWLVSGVSYEVEIEVEGRLPYTETVAASDLGPGETFVLNGGLPIELSP
jgi:hypothetical protein